MSPTMRTRSGKGHANRARTRQYLLLLALPTEVKRIILLELLYSSNALGFKTECDAPEIPCTIEPRNSRSASHNLVLQFEILTACKQLHREGNPILKANMFRVDAWLDDGMRVLWSFLESKPASENSICTEDAMKGCATLWAETRKVHSAVHCSSTD